MSEKLTKGQWLVGIDFNPSNNTDVRNIKTMASDFIDFIDKHGKDERLTSIAITTIEEAAMWAVKSATKKPMK